MVFYCKRATGSSCDVGMDDETDLSAPVRMFEQALKVIVTVPEQHRATLWVLLDVVQTHCNHNLCTAWARTWMRCSPNTGTGTTTECWRVSPDNQDMDSRPAHAFA